MKSIATEKQNSIKTTTPQKSGAPVSKEIFWPAVIIITTLILFMIAFEAQSKKAIDVMFSYCTDQLGFIYIWFGIFALAMSLWMGFGKYGDIRLGGPDAKPEFSRWSWIAMFFCSGIGTSLIYWSSIEWAYYYGAPPFGIEKNTQAAAEWAGIYGIFHWGPTGWATFLLPAYPIGYAFYNRKMPGLRLSTACAGVIGEKRASGPIGKIIDILMIFGLVGGTGTTLASGTPMLAEAICKMFKIPHTPGVDLIVVTIWTAIFTISVSLGLKRGIKTLSNINVMAVFFLCAIIFVLGPTFFMVNMFTDGMGILAKNYARMAFYTDPIRRSMFPQWWTIFYWAWWVAYGPYMGIFIARISKGRTFRDLTATVLLAGSAGCALFFLIFGNNAMHAQLNDIYPVIEVMNTQSPSAAIIGVLMQMPMKWVILALFIFVGFVYSGTTVDSSAYALATVSSEDIKEGQEPVLFNRGFWAIALGGIALVLMKIGGLGPLKTSSLVVSVPLVFLMVISFFSLLKWLRQDYSHLHQPRRLESDAERAAAENR